MKTSFENIKIRLANQNDNSQIIDLVKKYPMSSDSLSYVVDRSPNYFRLAEFQGNAHKVLVIEANKILGLLSLVFDEVYIDNKSQKIAYTCDLRVEPFIRKTGIADSLMLEGINTIKNSLGENANIFTCVLKDNIAGLKKNQNLSKHGILMKKAAEFKTYFILPFYTKILKNLNFNIRFAKENDIENMFKLWNEVNKNKNLTRVFTLESFTNWIKNTEGLGINKYLLAERDGTLVGFMGLWNQKETRRIIIHSQSKQMKFIKGFWNLGSKMIGIPKFPGTGQDLNFHNITNLCLKDNECFDQLIYNAFIYVKKNNSMFLTLALDKKDELNKYLKKFISSSTELYLLSNYKFENNNIFHVEISLG